jgi:hypothetical protein
LAGTPDTKEVSMAGSSLKEFKDVTDGKHMVDQVKAIKWRDIVVDPLGPVKYDMFERVAASYLQTIPVVAQRLDAIEQHLQQRGGGQSFVRAGELPDVGAQVKELREGIGLVKRTLAEIEQSLDE